jgi:hypothetical protein
MMISRWSLPRRHGLHHVSCRYPEHMTDPNTPPETALAPAATPSSPSTAATLPSGRTLTVRPDAQGEAIEVRSTSGDLELALVLTPEGPVLKLRGVRLQLDSTESVDLTCKQFNVHTQQGINLTSEGEFRLKTQGQSHLDAELIHLNGGDRTGYPDEANAAKIMAELAPKLAEQERNLLEAHRAAVEAHGHKH